MKCLILAAGYATRLYPLTENFPKPLLRVGEKTILDWLMDDIDGCGLIDEYIVVSNHKYARHFEKWASERPQRITVLDDGSDCNENRLGAVMDIAFAVKQLKIDDDLMVIAGDNVLDFSLTKFIAYARSRNAFCVMRYHEPDEARLRKCGVLEIGADDRVLSMEEKPQAPKSHWCCPPFYCYTRAALNLLAEGIADGCGVDAPGSFVAWIADRLPVYAMEMPGRRFDVGNLESYERICGEYTGITHI